MKTVQYDNLEFEVKKYKVGDSKIKYYVDKGETFYKLKDILKHLSKEIGTTLRSNQVVRRVEKGKISKRIDTETRTKAKSMWVNKEALLESLTYYLVKYTSEMNYLLTNLDITLENEEIIDFDIEDSSTILVRNVENNLYVSTLDMANQLGKEHKYIVELVNQLTYLSKDSTLAMSVQFEDCIQQKYYIDVTGRKLKYYLLDNKAFNMVVNNFQGFYEYKWAYINKFDEMEKELIALKNKEIKRKDIKSVSGKDNEFLKKFTAYRISDIAQELDLEPYTLNHFLVTHGVQYKVGNRYYLTENYDRNLVRDSFYRTSKGKLQTFMTWTSEGKKMIMKLVEDYMMNTNHEEEEEEFETAFI